MSEENNINFYIIKNLTNKGVINVAMTDEERRSKFKIALIKAGILMKDFCAEKEFDYNTFNQSINGYIAMKGEFLKEVDSFISQHN